MAIATPAGRYEPIYYFPVGLPSLFLHSALAIHLMRLVGSLICCAFLASAFESARRHSRLAVIGVAAAATPMVIFLFATVNPSSLEIAAAVCLWASGLALIEDPRGAGVGRLVTRVGLSATVLVQVRSLSALWTALIVGALAVIAGRDKLRQLIGRRDVRIWCGVFAASAVFAVAWVVAFDPLAQVSSASLHAQPMSAIVETSIGHLDLHVREMIGRVGWLDTAPPALTFYGWVIAAGVLLAVALATGSRRCLLVLAAVIIGVICIPVLIESSQAAKVGFAWQGRYTLPLASGIPILATMAGPAELRDAFEARLRVSLALVLVVAQGALFEVALRRYTVGLSGPLNLFGGRWSPPLGTPFTVALFLAGLIAYLALLMFPLRTRGTLRLGASVDHDEPSSWRHD